MYEQNLWLCRLKASLERLQRLTQSYADAMIDIFPQRASQLGGALGLDQDRITVSLSMHLHLAVLHELKACAESSSHQHLCLKPSISRAIMITI